ncbi:hypothetical protein [Arthrobacter sp. JSM 101049]|uniref:hypothetical protein n=1 Tax=Arthrobacter sp. JSM 101049 TaxID=929097 RepID=UPI0035639468
MTVPRSLERFTNFELYIDTVDSWLLSNCFDAEDGSFFQEVFSRSGDGAWERRGAYYVDDGAERDQWEAAISGTRASREVSAPDLPPVERPDRHARTIPVAVHYRAAHSVRRTMGWLLHGDTRRRQARS